jgi:hypothetical protein
MTETGEVLSNAIITVTFAKTSLVAIKPAQPTCFLFTSARTDLIFQSDIRKRPWYTNSFGNRETWMLFRASIVRNMFVEALLRVKKGKYRMDSNWPTAMDRMTSRQK